MPSGLLLLLKQSADGVATSREGHRWQACDYSPHYGRWASLLPSCSDCQTGGENDRLDAGAYHGSRRRLRHRISVVGPETPSTKKRQLVAGPFSQSGKADLIGSLISQR